MDLKALAEAARKLTEMMRVSGDVRSAVHGVMAVVGVDSLAALAETHPESFIGLVEDMESMIDQLGVD